MSFYMNEEALPDAIHLIRAGGELDLAAAPELKAMLEQALDRGARHIILDFFDVRFVDSTTIGAVVTAHRRLASHGGSLDIVCTHPNVMRILEIVGLDRMFSLHRTLEDALSYVPHPV